MIEQQERKQDIRRPIDGSPEKIDRVDGGNERPSPSEPLEKCDIHVRARLIEEKKKKIDREIEQRIQEEQERKRKINSQHESVRKIAEKQGR